VDRLLGLRISALDRTEPGDLMSGVTAGTTLLRDVTTDSLVGSITGTVMLLATLTLMGLLDTMLLAAMLAVFTLAGLVFGLVLPRIRRATRRAQMADLRAAIGYVEQDVQAVGTHAELVAANPL
jgi:ABC-type bacteriocin/lantibiotic exporter with double-glycine peptidase domain